MAVDTTLSQAALTAAGATTEGRISRLLLTALAVGFLMLFLVLPLAAVFVEALRQGLGAYLAALIEPDALAATYAEPWWEECSDAEDPGYRCM